MAYNTKKSGKLLVSGDDNLHNRLLAASDSSSSSLTAGNTSIDSNNNIDIPQYDMSDEAKAYIQSKVLSTREAAISYCKQMDTNFAIAEGGATGTH